MQETPSARHKSRQKGRRPRRELSREAIVRSAIQIADREGLEGVSIRRIAAALDARPMSLYDHIDSKDGLFTLMAEEVVAEIVLPGPIPEGWREAVSMIAQRHFAAFIRHPWSVTLFTTRSTFGQSGKLISEQVKEAIEQLPLDAEEVWLVYGVVNDYVLGYSLRAVSAASARGLAEAISPNTVAEFPDLEALQDSLRSRTSVERFDLGLEIVLDGIERRISKR